MRRALLVVAMLIAGCKDDAPCTIDPGEIDFGEVDATAISAQARSIKITNPSSKDRVCILEPLDPPFATDHDGELLVKGLSDQELRVTFLPRDGLQHHSTLRFHSEDGSCELSVELTGLGSGRIAPNPPSLEFLLGAGEMATQELVLQNSRRTPVPYVVDIERSSFQSTFSLDQSRGTVPAGGTVTVTVQAAPTGWDLATGAVRIATVYEQLRVPVTVRPSSPLLEVTPLTLDVPRAGVGQFVERTFRVSNAATSGFAVDALSYLTSPQVLFGDRNEVEFLPSQFPFLAEGDSTDLIVRVRPASAGPRTFQIEIVPSPSFVVHRVIKLTMQAEQLPKCELLINPRNSLQLELAGDGGVVGQVTFTNSGSTPCIVDNLRLDGRTLSMISGGVPQVEIPAGGSHQVTIAGPHSPDAGSVGAFRYHVLDPRNGDEWIELRSP